MKLPVSLAGNHMLLRVLPSVYPRRPEPIHCCLHGLAAMMLQLQAPEQQHLVRLIQAVAEQHPLVRMGVLRVLRDSETTGTLTLWTLVPTL